MTITDGDGITTPEINVTSGGTPAAGKITRNSSTFEFGGTNSTISEAGVGTFAVSVDSPLAKFTTIQCKTSGGFTFKNSNGTSTIGTLSDAGALSLLNTTTTAVGRLQIGYAVEGSGQIFNNIQATAIGGGGTGLQATVTGNGWGLALCTCANDGTQALVLFSSTDTKIISQNGTSWTVAGGSVHRFDYSNANNLITLTKVSAGDVSYGLTIIANTK